MILSPTATSDATLHLVQHLEKCPWAFGSQTAGELHLTNGRANSSIHEASKYSCNTPISVGQAGYHLTQYTRHDGPLGALLN
jgi:hypothetical protein